MAILQKQSMRQGQTLVMTPQLLQAIRLLQFSTHELVNFIKDEVEKNPLLEMLDGSSCSVDGVAAQSRSPGDKDDRTRDRYAEGKTSVEQAYGLGETGISTSFSSGVGRGGAGIEEPPNLEGFLAAPVSLRDHLTEQLMITSFDPRKRIIAEAIIGEIDEAGYFRESLAEIAFRLGASQKEAQEALSLIQSFDPAGVGARDLIECLSIQLKEKDRFDPAMATFIANLELVAQRKFRELARLCGVNIEDIADMTAELRSLDPKPGRQFGDMLVPSVVPDVIIRPAAEGAWLVELNSDALPRILINNHYAALVRATPSRDEHQSFISACIQNATWLTKSLEQRCNTILKVACEIVRLQEHFFTKGVIGLRPLTLKAIADSLGIHESTVSRATSNKYMMTPRGLFEMKYFFTVSITAGSGADVHSAESVRQRMKEMIENETAVEILSDAAIVAQLRAADINIARRTVAKYRESLNIPCSAERRKTKFR